MDIHTIGWNDFFEATFNSIANDGLAAARIAEQQRDRYRILCEAGELPATVSGRFRHEADGYGDFPAVGDWVAVRLSSEGDQAVIEHLLPRRTAFRRLANLGNNRTEEQVLAANVDTVLLVSGLDRDFNLKRIERYLSVAWESGATPVVVLNKADICEELEERIREVESIAIGVPVHPVSAMNREGVDELQQYVGAGKTVALLGSSGVGKSTIVNAIMGDDRQRTQEVRADDQRGRHTTTYRELIVLPTGGCVIDTPGMRSIQPWSASEGINRTFEDVGLLAQQCKFTDCTHESEPGCAVLAAVESGELEQRRLDNYRKMLKEEAYLERRQDKRAARAERDRWKAITKRMRDHPSKRK